MFWISESAVHLLPHLCVHLCIGIHVVQIGYITCYTLSLKNITITLHWNSLLLEHQFIINLLEVVDLQAINTSEISCRPFCVME